MKRFIMLCVIFVMCFLKPASAEGFFYFKGKKFSGNAEQWAWVGRGKYRRPFSKKKTATLARKREAAFLPKYTGPHRKLPWGVRVSWKQTSDPITRAPTTTIIVYREKKACVTTIIPTNEIVGVCEIGGN